MGTMLRRRGASAVDLRETAPATAPAVRDVPPPRGFDAGVPMGGTSVWNSGGTGGDMTRQDYLESLYGAYLACPWSSAAVDVVARTCTAGGLDLRPDAQLETGTAEPPQIGQLRALVDYVNPVDDIRQLLTGSLSDLQVFGDAFLEVVWLLGEPIALYPLDSPSMIPIADEHGVISAYTQQLDPTRTVTFDPHEVIHISLGGLRDSVYGVGPTHKAELAIRTWLFTKALLKESMRKGLPPALHADFPLDVPPNDVERFRQQYQARNLGINNIGNPVVSRGGAAMSEMQTSKIAELLATLSQGRDEILSVYGTPPAKVGVIESGNLGGGTGTSQDKSFKVNTCGPLNERLLEKLTFSLVRQAYGVVGWRFRAGDVDWRDDEVVELIRNQRLMNGSWSLNDYMRDIDQPEIGPTGDQHVLVARQVITLWDDIASLSKSNITAVPTPASVPVPGSPVAAAVAPAPTTPAEGPRSPEGETAALSESWRRAYQQRRRQTLKQLPAVDEDDADD